MTSSEKRIVREKRTIKTMVEMYCHDHHSTTQSLCQDCQSVWEYAQERLTCCPYAPDKPTCANCPVHCYKPEMRETVRKVMRYAGPRMLFRHPVLTILHLFDGQIKPRRKNKNAV